jgi:arylsulfatase A-like enzyme
MITRMDKDIGKLMANLKNLGLDENTLVMFSSDNGAHKEGGHDPEFFHSHGPLRGIKRDLYEGGIRVPTLARWPGKIKAGQVSDQVWAFWDFLPTAAELAGAAALKGVDGISMVNALLGKKQQDHEYLYWEAAGTKLDTVQQAVRWGNWKAVRNAARASWELYDLSQDIGEVQNLAVQKPDVIGRIDAICREAHSPERAYSAGDNETAADYVR